MARDPSVKFGHFMEFALYPLRGQFDQIGFCGDECPIHQWAANCLDLVPTIKQTWNAKFEEVLPTWLVALMSTDDFAQYQESLKASLPPTDSPVVGLN
jgi:hypothetical protein